MRFKVDRQLDSSDCGAACLQMIARYHGKVYNLIFLKERIFVGKQGVSLLNIARGAESLGFRTLNVKLTIDFLKENKPVPCIIHINGNHFVVLYKISKNLFTKKIYYHVADPAHGLVQYTESEFVSAWINDNAGIALLLTPKNNLEEGEQHETSSIRQLWKYFKPFKVYFFNLLIGLIGVSLISFILPFFTQSIVDKGIGGKDVRFIAAILIAQIMLLTGQLVINFIRSWVLLHVNVRVSINIISDFLSKLMRIPIKFFDGKSQGDIMQRIQDHRLIESFLTNGVLNTFFSLINVAIFSIVLGIYGLIYLVLFWVGSIISVLWTWGFNEKRKRINYIRFQRNRENQDSIFEILHGMEEIKLNNNDLQRKWEWQKIQIKLFRLNLSNLKLEQFQNVGNFFINQLKNTILIFFTSKAVIDGSITLGVMMSISYIIGLLNSPIEQLTEFIRTLQDTKLSMERLTELQFVEDEYKAKNQEIYVAINNQDDILIRELSFGYEGPVTKLVLKNLNIKFEGGKTTAIVGPSGCGKTTLMKLLLNYYQPHSGSIQIGDVPINQISVREWRDQIGSVMQNGYIFSDTVINNVTMRNEVDQEWLEYILSIANCDDFVYKLPFGLQTKIGSSGINLSTGQKQRLLIARALYKKPEIIIFDEATSALDTKNELEISNNLNKFFENKTAIIIAHRLSTVKNADNIIVMDQGRIIESGSHNELVRLKGFYFNLIENQLELN